MMRLARDPAAQARTASGANIPLGIWLMVSPWVFDYSGKSAVLGNVAVGALIALLATIRVASLHESASLSGINLLLAAWVVASPWVYKYPIAGGALCNEVLAGVLVAGLAIWSAIATDAERRRE
jgi:hypothetical protein